MLQAICTVFTFDLWSNGKTITLVAIFNGVKLNLVTNIGMLTHKASKLGLTLNEFMSSAINTQMIAEYEACKAGETFVSEAGEELEFTTDWNKLSIDSDFQVMPKEGFIVVKAAKKKQTDDAPVDA